MTYSINGITTEFSKSLLFSLISYYCTSITIGLPEDTIEIANNNTDSLGASAIAYEQILAGETGNRIFTSSS
jgi:hypothetical protein